MAKRSNRARKVITTTTAKDAFKGVEAQQRLASGKLYQWREKDRPRLLNAVEMPSYMQEALNFCASNPFVGLDDIAHNGLVTHTVETTERIIFSKMTDEQLKQILPFLNKRCFKNPLTLEQLKEVFQYKRTHVQVKSVPVLAYFFDALKDKGLLADGWQTTIQEKEMFVSKSGKPLNQRYIGRKITEFLGTKSKDRKRTGGRLKEYEVIKKDDALRVSLKWKKVKGEKSYTPRIKNILQAVKDADDTIKLL